VHLGSFLEPKSRGKDREGRDERATEKARIAERRKKRQAKGSRTRGQEEKEDRGAGERERKEAKRRGEIKEVSRACPDLFHKTRLACSVKSLPGYCSRWEAVQP
jgi:hypothetical protein